METTDSLADHKDESPSQGQTGHLPSIKRDHESLDDFEDITKDVSPVKEATAQFLRYESGDKRDPAIENRINFDDNNSLIPDSLLDDKEFVSTSVLNSATQIADIPKVPDITDNLLDWCSPKSTITREPNFSPVVAEGDQIGLSKNFMHYEQTIPPICSAMSNESDQFLLDETQKGTTHSSKVEDNKLLDFDEFTSSADLCNFQAEPKKSSNTNELMDFGQFNEQSDRTSNNLDLFMEQVKSEQQESHNLKVNQDPESEPDDSKPEPNIKFQSRVELEPEPEAEPEPDTVFGSVKTTEKPYSHDVTSKGDGLHVKEAVETGVSDNEESAPEPLPKDYPEIGALEAKAFLSAIGLYSWFHPEKLNPKVEALVYWRDPKKSGIVFGSVLAVLLSLTLYSLISVVAYSSIIVLVAAICFRSYKFVLQTVQKTSEGHPFKTYLVMVLNHPVLSEVNLAAKEYLEVDLTLNPDKVREVTDIAVAHVNTAITELRRRFLVEDFVGSLKFGVLLWCLTFVGAWFNGLSLLIIAFVGLFTLPKVYENNKTQIDANLEIVKAKINDVTEKVKAVVPIGKKPEEAKDKDE